VKQTAERLQSLRPVPGAGRNRPNQ
jgi:hypothetical protein